MKDYRVSAEAIADPWGQMSPEARELALFMENDYHLWMVRRPDFWRMLDRHDARGNWERAKALKGLDYFVTEGAKKYGAKFDPTDRKMVANYFVALWEEDTADRLAGF